MQCDSLILSVWQLPSACPVHVGVARQAQTELRRKVAYAVRHINVVDVGRATIHGDGLRLGREGGRAHADPKTAGPRIVYVVALGREGVGHVGSRQLLAVVRVVQEVGRHRSAARRHGDGKVHLSHDVARGVGAHRPRGDDRSRIRRGDEGSGRLADEEQGGQQNAKTSSHSPFGYSILALPVPKYSELCNASTLYEAITKIRSGFITSFPFRDKTTPARPADT